MVPRRTVLVGVAAATFGAGCLSAPDDADADDPTSDPDSPTSTPSPSPSPPPSASAVSLVDRSFRQTGASCGEGRDRATVAYDSGRTRVRVAGTIRGATPCRTAVLRSATLDDDGVFRVVVDAEPDPNSGGCIQCLADLTYEAAFEFEGGLPRRTVVCHGDAATPVATAIRSESTANATTTTTET